MSHRLAADATSKPRVRGLTYGCRNNKPIAGTQSCSADAATGPFRRQNIRMVDADHGARGGGAGVPGRLATGSRIGAVDQAFRISIPNDNDLGSRRRTIRRSAVYLWNDCLVVDRIDYRGPVK